MWQYPLEVFRRHHAHHPSEHLSKRLHVKNRSKRNPNGSPEGFVVKISVEAG
jgi:hypothetical protein